MQRLFRKKNPDKNTPVANDVVVEVKVGVPLTEIHLESAAAAAASPTPAEEVAAPAAKRRSQLLSSYNAKTEQNQKERGYGNLFNTDGSVKDDPAAKDLYQLRRRSNGSLIETEKEFQATRKKVGSYLSGQATQPAPTSRELANADAEDAAYAAPRPM